MEQRNLNSKPARNLYRHTLKLNIRFFRPDGRNWQRIFAIVVLLSMLLSSPAGTNPVYALAAPDLISPLDYSTITGVEAPPLGIPEFRWTAVPGATLYRLQISNNIGFTTTILDKTTINTTYTPITANLFSDGVWYWRVRVESPAPPSNFSTIWRFTKQWATPTNFPTLISPANGATIDFYDAPIFSWTPVSGNARYELQIYTSPGGWASPIKTASTITTTYQPTAKLPNGVYYWRVVPTDPANPHHDGTPSAERTFTTNYNPVITLLEPANDAEPTFTPTFRWTAVRGAQFYRLQYTTDPSFSAGVTTVDTRNTAYTPTDTLSNDVNYYWRVRANSGVVLTDWTPSRTFIKRWYIKPVLLSPTNNYQHVRFPIFSWTPVPGAKSYKVDLDFDPNFSYPIFDTVTTANTFSTPSKYGGGSTTYYWRVTPYDGNDKAGVPSNTSSFLSYPESLAPHQVYPFFYYPPDSYAGFPGITTNPHEDRTVPLPIFMWHRVYLPAGDANAGEIYADAYRLQVSADPTFTTGVWNVDTENTVATPNILNNFTPLPDTDYFWRVRPLIDGSEVAYWSQRWKTRIDLTQGLTPTAGPSPTLIRPTDGFEYAEATPLLEWFPMSGATSYDVEISQDASFTTALDTATVPYPAYAPTQSLAQRNLGDVDFGVYYWRVRVTGGAWSDIRRFQISAQSQYQINRTLGAATNRLQIGSDPVADIADPDYDVTDLQITQSSTNWYFGFHVPGSPTKNVTYALYLDLDHLESSGAPSDARGYSVTTISTFRPEYAIYIFQEAGAFSAERAFIYKWGGSSWDTVDSFDNIGGALIVVDDYIEISLLNTSIGYQDTTGSYAATLLTIPASGGGPQDSVPSDPNVPGSGQISRFANVTERMNLIMPPNDAGVDPSVFPSVLPFFWDWSIRTPWAGAIMKAYLDPLFTTEKATYTLVSDASNWAQTSHAWNSDFTGDNTYYWRIQPDYNPSPSVFLMGVWSQGWRFERQGFIPQNLQTSVTFATPTFTWDMVEGAESYDLQVSTDPGFGTTDIDTNTVMTSYTHTGTLPNAIYYWRVRVKRHGSVINDWTASQSFTLALPTPTGLYHQPPADPPAAVGRAPTLCWDPLIVNNIADEPVLAAWKYHVQVSKEPTFSTEWEKVDDTEQNCWTPTKGYDDAQYYWRVAMVDGNGLHGEYSPYETFIKQYPITTLISPLNGESIFTAPTFVWTSVFGAANYKLEVSQVSNFGTIFDTATTPNTRYTPIKVYPINKTYYWRVAIVDADGKVGPFNNATIILSPYPYHLSFPIIKKP